MNATLLQCIKEYTGSASCINHSVFIDLLSKHGEVLLHLDSGAVWALHLGDTGDISSLGIRFTDSKNSHHFFPWDKIERMELHSAHQEN